MLEEERDERGTAFIAEFVGRDSPDRSE